MDQSVYTFARGTFPMKAQHHGKRATEGKAIQVAAVPDVLTIPVLQHIGEPCLPLVKKGDRVLVGQMIAACEKGLYSPVHSSVSGEVMAVEPRMHPRGKKVLSIVIKNDHMDEMAPHTGANWEQLSPAQLLERIREAGVVGVGGACFPTHAKLNPPKDKKVDVVLLNGAECEPYLTSDDRIMREHADKVVEGLRIFMKVLGVERGIIGVEQNKPEAIAALRKAIQGISGLAVKVLKAKYPQGAEKQLIDALIRKEVPFGGYPYDVGVVVQNVSTAYIASEAIRTGLPLYSRVVTLSGPIVNNPGNYQVRIGTPISFLIEQAGGLSAEAGKVIDGGPMMGHALFDLDVPVLKGTGGILVFPRETAHQEAPSPCIRCGLCASACPLRLQPLLISGYAERGMFDRAQEHRAMVCCECGTCSYVCPARRPLLHGIRTAKAVIQGKRS